MKFLSSVRQLPCIWSCNARSILPKIDEVRATLANKSLSIDIFCCCETWLHQNIDDQLIQVPGFSVFRSDRKDRIGGGCAVWMRDNIPCVEITVTPPFELECLFLLLSHARIVLITMYIPPLLATKENQAISDFIINEVDKILRTNVELDIVLCGDLNRFDLAILYGNLNLVNCNKKPTYGGAELDFILLSESISELYGIEITAPLDISCVPHSSLLATPRFPPSGEFSSGITRKVYDLRTSHVNDFLLRLCRVDWSFIFDHQSSLDDKCMGFQRILTSAADECIPASFVKFTPNDKPLITPVVKSLINARWTAFRSGNFTVFKHLKEKVREEIRKAKVGWTKRVAMKNLWGAVSTSLGTREKNPIDDFMQGFESIEQATDHISKALSSHFQAKEPYLIPCQVDEWSVQIDRFVVMRLLKSLKTKKASFDIPNRLYKEAAPFISEVLAHLFTLSVKERYVPVIWKIAAVTPIPKIRKPTVNDLRPISILSTPAKLLERIILQSTKNTFAMHMEDRQFGFRLGSSTLCALLCLDDCVTKYLDDNTTSGVAIVSYDLSKAFDKLPHNRILERLVDLDFPNGFIEWVASYLDGRQQYVRYGEHCSECVDVTSGVPQGSILGPLLFVTTISNYISNSTCHVVKYADDTTLCFPLHKNDIDASLNNIILEHKRIMEWSEHVGLPINASKSKCLTIRKSKDCPLPYLPDVCSVNKLRILGFTFNSKWNHDDQVSKVVTLASRRLYALRVLKPTLTKHQMIEVFNSLVRSHFEYCAPLLLGMSSANKNKLERVQKRFHRLICGKACSEPCLTSPNERRKLLSLRFLQKALKSGHVLHHHLPHRLKSGRFRLPPRRTTQRSQSFFPLICEMFNSDRSTTK